MASTDVLVPGARDVRGTLDAPSEWESGQAADREQPLAGTDTTLPGPVVVACPPHPQHGGNRRDRRVRAAADALVDRGVGCLRIDYGPWDEGYGEREDVRNAVRWADDRTGRVGLFGYSFGATIALSAAATVERTLGAVSVLSPTARVAPDLDAVAALDRIEAPIQVVYGSRDDTVDWKPVVERASERGATVTELPADHFFVGQQSRVGALAADFLASGLS